MGENSYVRSRIESEFTIEAVVSVIELNSLVENTSNCSCAVLNLHFHTEDIRFGLQDVSIVPDRQRLRGG